MTNAISVQDILTRIDRVLDDTSYLQAALSTIEKLPDRPDGEAESTRARAEAIAAIVREREETNRQVLRLLEQAGTAGEAEPDDEE